jgi:hypothetical protein
MSYLDPKWVYHRPESHDDASAFRRRQRERARTAEAARAQAAVQAEQTKREAAAKVRQIGGRTGRRVAA